MYQNNTYNSFLDNFGFSKCSSHPNWSQADQHVKILDFMCFWCISLVCLWCFAPWIVVVTCLSLQSCALECLSATPDRSQPCYHWHVFVHKRIRSHNPPSGSASRLLTDTQMWMHVVDICILFYFFQDMMTSFICELKLSGGEKALPLLARWLEYLSRTIGA